MPNRSKTAHNAEQTKPTPNSVTLTDGQNVPRPNPSSQVTWAPGTPPGGTPISKPLPAKAEQ